MISLWLWALLALPLSYFLNNLWCLRRNILAAKATGLPYVVLPWSNLNFPWIVLRPILQPYLDKLPIRDALWFKLLSVDWPWQQQYAVFQRLHADNFLYVSPSHNYFNTADAAVIDQITRRRHDFPKPTEVYGALEIYGQNVVTTEGNLWKHHRKTVSPPFNEKNNRMVWHESLRQAQSMVNGWMGDQTETSATIYRVADDCMKLSLHVISCAGFGVNLDWPAQGEEPLANGHASSSTRKEAKASEVKGDHTLSYVDALQSLLHNMLWIFIFPLSLMKWLPFSGIKRSYTSYIEWGKHLRELFDNKKDDIATGKAQEGMDLMGFLCKGAGMTSDPTELDSEKSRTKPVLSDTEIMGNAFVFLLAGHETAANSIHFSCLFLAMHPPSQRRLQKSLDRIFASRPIAEWEYERDFNALFSTMAGAVLAEELRLIPPVPAIPKCVPPNASSQTLVIDKQKYTLPPATYINLVSLAAHRNPKTWPAGPPSDPENPVHPTSNTDNDLEEFKPERWLRESTQVSDSASAEKDVYTEDAPNTATGTNSSHALHRPPRGAYIPFSEGYRACLGRRFAQVEVLAALAVIFKNYSVELGVERYASDEEVERMGSEERRELHGKAARDVRELMKAKMGMLFTMQMRGTNVGVRVVRRGRERFADACQ
ncbi:MAG: hypothetical protein LQ339_006365 [Xanthoria mediterranea]|nr:MAG: hypothetical protein LQ339_006365 [Xanthoria mediterranea]